jgi:DnaJ-class molecular chaperone
MTEEATRFVRTIVPCDICGGAGSIVGKKCGACDGRGTVYSYRFVPGTEETKTDSKD